MQLQTRSVGDALVLEVEGRLDAHTYERLKEVWLNSPESKYLIVDLSQTLFIDSIGLATLVSGLKVARQRGGDLLLVNPTQASRTILDLTSMNKVFQIVLTVEDALASVLGR
jgi:anti-sigma B factor antagonist